MAAFTINIPDAQLSRLFPAFSFLLNNGKPVDAAFVLSKIQAYVQAVVASYEAQQAQSAVIVPAPITVS